MRNSNSQTLPTPNRPFFFGKLVRPFLFLLVFFISSSGYAQVELADGQAAIEEAATGIEEYFEPIRNLVFIMAGIISLLGAIRVYMVRLVIL